MRNNITPANILANYIWELLHENMNMQKINGLVPVVAIDDEPQLQGAGLPYLVYGWVETFGAERRRGTFSLRICGARSVAELGEITTTISRAFEMYDTSARHINEYSSRSGSPFVSLDINNVNHGIRFTHTEVTFLTGGEPAEEEGYPDEGLVSIDYSYVTHQEAKEYHGPSGTWMTPSEVNQWELNH